VAVATHPASDVAADELARHLDAGLRDLVHFTDLADRVSADDLWDKVIAIEPACARRIVHTAATLASRRLAVVQVPGPSLSLPWAAGPGIFSLCAAILEGTGRLSGPLALRIARLATARRRAGRRSRLCWPIPVPSPRMRPESRQLPHIRVEVVGGLPEPQRVRSQPGPQQQPA
jgi:hypothetical protein